MEARIFVKELVFNDDSKILFDSDDIVVIVGANNSGKSTLLREMLNLFNELSWLPNALILKGMSIDGVGSFDDLIALMEKLSFRKGESQGQKVYEGVGWGMHTSAANSRWVSFKSAGLTNMLPLFIKHISSDGRLSIANQVNSINVLSDMPQHPIHFLYKSDELELKFSNLFHKAFKKDLIVNRGGGSVVYLHVGARPSVLPTEDRISESYLKRLSKLPVIQTQGDGMRSFVGLLLEVVLGNHSAILIDEPEVFLHPPQARLLGKMLINDVPQGKQIFISTHSEDFLKGLLDSNSSRVKVIRLDRDDRNINHVTELTKVQVRDTWSDPLLRHSNVLSGLFHNVVVLCEGDMDCRFYSTVLNAVSELNRDKDSADPSFISIPDVLFIHCGGKQRMPMVVKSLIKLGVPIKVICDFDLLNKVEPLKAIFETLGGDWSLIDKDWNILKLAVEAKKPELETTDVKDRIVKILEVEKEKTFSDKSVADIKEILRKTSAWSTAKNVGKTFVPSGDATLSYQKLITALKKQGLFVVEIGEIENFDKSVGNHGPKWVNEVLLKDVKTSPEFVLAREFVSSLFQ